MTKAPLASAAIGILSLVACLGDAAAAPIAPSAVVGPLNRALVAQITFRKRYYREYAPYSYYGPPVVTYWAPPIYGYAAPPPVYYSPPVVYAPPVRHFYGPPVVYYETDYYRPRGFAPYYTGW